MDVVAAAKAIHDIAVTSMVHAVHLISTQRGYDVRDFSWWLSEAPVPPRQRHRCELGIRER